MIIASFFVCALFIYFWGLLLDFVFCYLIAERNPPALLEERALLTLCPCVLALLAFWSLLAVALRISRSHVVLESVQKYGRSCGAKWWARNLQNGPGGGRK